MSVNSRIFSALVAAALLVPAAPAAARSSCASLGLVASRSSGDPVLFQDAGRINVAARGTVRALRVELRRGSAVYATGKATRTGDVELGFRRTMSGGTYTLVVTGKRTGCKVRSRGTARWRFSSTTLPVVASRPSAYAEDYASVMRVVLRSVGGAKISGLRVDLVSDTGVRLGSATQPGEFASTVVLDVPYQGRLVAGEYRLRLHGDADGRAMERVEDFALQAARGGGGGGGGGGGAGSGTPAAPPTAGARVQRVTVQWSDGASKGSDTAGFEVPGLGTGEIVCRPDAGWLRFFSSAPGRQISMMNWMLKDWMTGGEQAIREAVLTAETGQQFNEGFNKFGPPEKQGSGSFEGIISDRGPFGAPAPGVTPTTVALHWSWDYRNEGRGSCTVNATFVTDAPPEERPLARSLQIAWRGDANAAGRDGATAIVPGFGRVDATCGAGMDGVRWITVTGPDGGQVVLREGSDVTEKGFPTGPVAMPLPNNGQMVFTFGGGAKLIVSSRHKVNDPNTDNNFCFIAAQAIVP